MKFWELASVCRTETELMEHLAVKPEWARYLDWYRDLDNLVQEQDRAKLDAELPDDVCIFVLSASRAEYFQSADYVRVRRHSPTDRQVSAVDIVRQFGGSFLEDVCEAGLAPIPAALA